MNNPAFERHIAETLAHFAPYQGNLANELFSGKMTGFEAGQTELLPSRNDVHDWVDHCLFGRALTRAGDSVHSYSSSMPNMNFEHISEFVLDNISNFRAWEAACEQSGKRYDMTLFLDYSGSKALYTEATPMDLRTLLSAYENQQESRARYDNFKSLHPCANHNPFESEKCEAGAQAVEYFQMIGEKIFSRAAGENVFASRRELILAPWVKETVEGLLAGREPQPIPEKILRELDYVNREKVLKPGLYVQWGKNELDSLHRALSEVKADIYCLATYLFNEAAKDPEVKERIIAMFQASGALGSTEESK